MNRINQCLIYTDVCLDFVPQASRFTNAITLLFKAAVHFNCVPESVKRNEFAQHLQNKSKIRCITVLVTPWGNIALAIYKIASWTFNKLMDKISNLSPEQQARLFPPKKNEIEILIDNSNARLAAQRVQFQEEQITKYLIEKPQKLRGQLNSSQDVISNVLDKLKSAIEATGETPTISQIENRTRIIKTMIETTPFRDIFYDLKHIVAPDEEKQKAKAAILADPEVCKVIKIFRDMISTYIDETRKFLSKIYPHENHPTLEDALNELTTLNQQILV